MNKENTMSSVQIAQENMSIGEGRNLAPFVSTAEFYAKIYDADIVLLPGKHQIGENVGVFIKSESVWPKTKPIHAPEKIEVARVLHTKHLWILFDIARKPWDGDRIVFGRILEEAQRSLFDIPQTFDLRQRSRLAAESSRTELTANAGSLRTQFIFTARHAAEEAAEATRQDIEKNITRQAEAGKELKGASPDLHNR